jgi:hypothetical protein
MLAGCTIDFLERKFRATCSSNMLMATLCMLCFIDVTYNLLDSLISVPWEGFKSIRVGEVNGMPFLSRPYMFLVMFVLSVLLVCSLPLFLQR